MSYPSLPELRYCCDRAAKLYPNFCKLGEDGVLEFYCDNQILSSLRSCQGYFREAFINNLEPKSDGVNLDNDNIILGLWFHDIMEIVDKSSLTGELISTEDAMRVGIERWSYYNIEQYAQSRGYANIGGLVGALELVKDYMEFFLPSQDKIKIITTELVFGYDKEAPVNDWNNPLDNQGRYPYRAYLIGRPDGVIETPLGVGPKDYKTSSRVDAVRAMYKPSEQLTGYVYGVSKIFSSKLESLGRKCNTAYLIAVNKKSVKDPKNRVVKIPYTYSDADLEAYRLRMIATFDMLFEQLVLNYYSTWDTSKCTNMYFRICPFHKLHSADITQRDVTINAFYQKRTPWNPLTRGKDAASVE